MGDAKILSRKKQFWDKVKNGSLKLNQFCQHLNKNFFMIIVLVKGQNKSEWIYESINLKDFCPMYYENSRDRNPSNLSGHFLEIEDFMNSFWLNLTFIRN